MKSFVKTSSPNVVWYNYMRKKATAGHKLFKNSSSNWPKFGAHTGEKRGRLYYFIFLLRFNFHRIQLNIFPQVACEPLQAATWILAQNILNAYSCWNLMFCHISSFFYINHNSDLNLSRSLVMSAWRHNITSTYINSLTRAYLLNNK